MKSAKIENDLSLFIIRVRMTTLSNDVTVITAVNIKEITSAQYSGLYGANHILSDMSTILADIASLWVNWIVIHILMVVGVMIAVFIILYGENPVAIVCPYVFFAILTILNRITYSVKLSKKPLLVKYSLNGCKVEFNDVIFKHEGKYWVSNTLIISENQIRNQIRYCIGMSRFEGVMHLFECTLITVNNETRIKKITGIDNPRFIPADVMLYRKNIRDFNVHHCNDWSFIAGYSLNDIVDESILRQIYYGKLTRAIRENIREVFH